MEASMINHILVPLDGSTLAECVLPHVAAIAPVTHARITFLHVLQQSHNGGGTPAVDPVEWHLQKQNVEKYLEGIVKRLSGARACSATRRNAAPATRARLSPTS